MKLKKRKFQYINLILFPIVQTLFAMPNASARFSFDVYPTNNDDE